MRDRAYRIEQRTKHKPSGNYHGGSGRLRGEVADVLAWMEWREQMAALVEAEATAELIQINTGVRDADE